MKLANYCLNCGCNYKYELVICPRCNHRESVAKPTQENKIWG